MLQQQLNAYQKILDTDKYKNVKVHLTKHVQGNTERESSDIKWTFTLACLNILDKLQTCMTEAIHIFKKKQENITPKDLKPSQAPPLSPDHLSVLQQKNILTALNFIVILGICPNLEHGVGIPMERRSEFASLLARQSPQHGHSNDEASSCTTHVCRLYECVSSLMKCVNVPSIGALILSRHLHDVLSALLQLLFTNAHPASPKKVIGQMNQKGQRSDEPLHSYEGVISKITPTYDPTAGTSALGKLQSPDEKLHNTEDMNQQITVFDLKKRKPCEEWLDLIMNKIHQPVLVRELMLLQSGVALVINGYCS